jgi:hypothetical protein
MKKIILLVGFFLLLVFPAKAWDQNPTSGYEDEEFMRQSQLNEETTDQKGPMDKQQVQNKTGDLKPKNLNKPLDTKDQEDQQKQHLDHGNVINPDLNK